MKRVGEAVFSYRWYIGMVVLVLCVLLEIHGSSIGLYAPVLHTPDTAVLGSNRSIRSDEFLVNTPLAFSQYYNHFGYYSDIVRGTATDMFMVYGQPVRDAAIVFRPFHWGYLFLPPAKGLAFFWMGRLIVLFLISLDFGMLICRRKISLALVYALGIALAPVVQWWFAVNSVAEILIFGQLGVLLLAAYMDTSVYVRRALLALGLFWCAGVYTLSIYPAWQVPCAYVFGAAALWLLGAKWHDFRKGWRDVVLLLAGGAILLGALLPIFSRAADTIALVRQTVYPGSRMETGMVVAVQKFFAEGMNSVVSIWLPVKDLTVGTNNSEAARMFDLAPLGIGLALACWRRLHRCDALLRNLLLVQVFFLLWCFLPWPVWLAKATLMSNVTARVLLGIGIINLMLLVRSLAVWNPEIRWHRALGLSAAGAVLAVTAAYSFYPDVFSYKYVLASVGIVFLLWYLALRGKLMYLAIAMAVVMLYAGGRVNPIAHGTASIYQSGLVQKIQEIAAEDHGLWAVSGMGHWNNITIMAGAPTINSTNVYPVLERWAVLDPSGEQRDIYNRYAHIHLEITAEPTTFRLEFPDTFSLKLNMEDIPRLHVKYILSRGALSVLDFGDVHLTDIFQDHEYHIYRVEQ